VNSDGDDGAAIPRRRFAARRDLPGLLDLAEEALDGIALAVEGGVDLALDLAVAPGRDMAAPAPRRARLAPLSGRARRGRRRRARPPYRRTRMYRQKALDRRLVRHLPGGSVIACGSP